VSIFAEVREVREEEWMETIKVEVLYEEIVFRGAFALPVEEREVDSLIVLFCSILKIGFEFSEIFLLEKRYLKR
jgi:hypothetical protein